MVGLVLRTSVEVLIFSFVMPDTKQERLFQTLSNDGEGILEFLAENRLIAVWVEAGEISDHYVRGLALYISRFIFFSSSYPPLESEVYPLYLKSNFRWDSQMRLRYASFE